MARQRYCGRTVIQGEVRPYRSGRRVGRVDGEDWRQPAVTGWRGAAVLFDPLMHGTSRHVLAFLGSPTSSRLFLGTSKDTRRARAPTAAPRSAAKASFIEFSNREGIRCLRSGRHTDPDEVYIVPL
jgi:hypothetical protein